MCRTTKVGMLLCDFPAHEHNPTFTRWHLIATAAARPRLLAFPVMRSDPLASRGGRTCLYSSCSKTARGGKLITEALWSNVNTMLHKEQRDTHQS